MDYQETNREDFNAENIQCDEIPVATVTDEEANRLIPADAAADDENYLMITFGKPYDFEGETFKGIDLSGLENIKGRQLTAIEKAFGKTTVVSSMPETPSKYASVYLRKETRLLPRRSLRNRQSPTLFKADYKTNFQRVSGHQCCHPQFPAVSATTCSKA